MAQQNKVTDEETIKLLPLLRVLSQEIAVASNEETKHKKNKNYHKAREASRAQSPLYIIIDRAYKMREAQQENLKKTGLIPCNYEEELR